MRSRMHWCVTACRRRRSPSSARARQASWSRRRTVCASRRTVVWRSCSSRTSASQALRTAGPFPAVPFGECKRRHGTGRGVKLPHNPAGEDMRRPVRFFAIVALLSVIVCSSALGQTLKVGSKNFTEQFVVAELYAAALEAAGISVERKINLGPTAVAHAALLSGAIDLYPEYTGTALGAVMKVATDSFSPKE